MKIILCALLFISSESGSGEVEIRSKPKQQMADYKKYLDFVAQREGGFVNDKDDSGGATKMGITIETYRAFGFDNDADSDIDIYDLKSMTQEQFEIIFQVFWRKVKADSINDQMVGNLVFQFQWGSGISGRKLVQRVLNADFGFKLTVDGVIGKMTIKAINSCDADLLTQKLHEARLRFFIRLTEIRPKDKKYISGWFKRQNLLMSTEPWFIAEKYKLENFKVRN